jgi:hypothetical protein
VKAAVPPCWWWPCRAKSTVQRHAALLHQAPLHGFRRALGSRRNKRQSPQQTARGRLGMAAISFVDCCTRLGRRRACHRRSDAAHEQYKFLFSINRGPAGSPRCVCQQLITNHIARIVRSQLCIVRPLRHTQASQKAGNDASFVQGTCRASIHGRQRGRRCPEAARCSRRPPLPKEQNRRLCEHRFQV